jgi:hypothetical protein
VKLGLLRFNTFFKYSYETLLTPSQESAAVSSIISRIAEDHSKSVAQGGQTATSLKLRARLFELLSRNVGGITAEQLQEHIPEVANNVSQVLTVALGLPRAILDCLRESGVADDEVQFVPPNKLMLNDKLLRVRISEILIELFSKYGTALGEAEIENLFTRSAGIRLSTLSTKLGFECRSELLQSLTHTRFLQIDNFDASRNELAAFTRQMIPASYNLSSTSPSQPVTNPSSTTAITAPQSSSVERLSDNFSSTQLMHLRSLLGSKLQGMLLAEVKQQIWPAISLEAFEHRVKQRPDICRIVPSSAGTKLFLPFDLYKAQVKRVIEEALRANGGTMDVGTLKKRLLKHEQLVLQMLALNSGFNRIDTLFHDFADTLKFEEATTSAEARLTLIARTNADVHPTAQVSALVSRGPSASGSSST